MKTNILYKLGIAALLAALLVLTGCKDSFLEVEPGKKMTLTEYFSTDEHIYEAVAATYHPMRLFDWNGATYNPINICSEVMTDNFWAGGADLNDYTYWHYMEDFKADPLHTLEGIWKQCYLGVKNANDVLSYVETGKDKITAEHQKLYTEEAMVLRAFYYCQLWKFYGYIPVYMKNLTSPYTCEQSAPDAAYDAIITSLEEAIAIGALPMQWDDANLGRVNRATAYMLYAEMVMYQNDESRYSKALEYMRQIISSGQFALHADYAALWTKEGEWTKESIFEINYTDGPNGKRAYGGGVGNVGGTWLPRLISPEGGVAADG
ncbi:RagB/SusD family nutrient uptake outer membrane protein, partial [Segatella buccae]